MSDTIDLTSSRVRAEIRPADGGRLAQLSIDRTPLLIGPDDVDDDVAPIGWGSFPMVPWAGRIRDGRFVFDGVEYRLPVRFDAHAIHGVGVTRAWEVVGASDTAVTLRLELPTGDEWPFGGTVEQVVTIDDDGLTTTMTVTAGPAAFPVTLGWHPWFRKPSELGFSPTAMYRRDDAHIAIAELVPVPDAPWDDCFLNTEPVSLLVDDTAVLVTSDCDHWVVFDERSFATCVEPQTGPPDAFNIAPRRLEPGESCSAWYRIAAAPATRASSTLP